MVKPLSEGMKRKIIKNYESLSAELLELVQLNYPNGFSSFIIPFFGPDGKLFHGFLLDTDEITYMIRVNKVKPEKTSEEGEVDEINHRDEEEESNYIVEDEATETDED